MKLSYKDYTFHASGHRVKNCSSRYSFLNDERDVLGHVGLRTMVTSQKVFSLEGLRASMYIQTSERSQVLTTMGPMAEMFLLGGTHN